MSETAAASGNLSGSTFFGLREIEVLILFLTLITFAYFYQASDHNTAARFDLIRSLLEQHTCQYLDDLLPGTTPPISSI